MDHFWTSAIHQQQQGNYGYSYPPRYIQYHQQQQHKRDSHPRIEAHSVVRTSIQEVNINETSSTFHALDYPSASAIYETSVIPLNEEIEYSVKVVENFIKCFQPNGTCVLPLNYILFSSGSHLQGMKKSYKSQYAISACAPYLNVK